MHKTEDALSCTIARALDVFGDRWTLLVLREAFFGTRRYEDFRKRLGIARNILADRLDRLVEAGILERRRYSERPPRDEYRLTPKGLDLNHVFLALKAWGDHWTADPQALPAVTRHVDCGEIFDAVPVCSYCGEEVHARNVRTEPGRGATEHDRRSWAERRAARTSR
jgi:DNA-binding HxlR family transcriptional regulator